MCVLSLSEMGSQKRRRRLTQTPHRNVLTSLVEERRYCASPSSKSALQGRFAAASFSFRFPHQKVATFDFNMAELFVATSPQNNFVTTSPQLAMPFVPLRNICSLHKGPILLIFGQKRASNLLFFFK